MQPSLKLKKGCALPSEHQKRIFRELSMHTYHVQAQPIPQSIDNITSHLHTGVTVIEARFPSPRFVALRVRTQIFLHLPRTLVLSPSCQVSTNEHSIDRVVIGESRKFVFRTMLHRDGLRHINVCKLTTTSMHVVPRVGERVRLVLMESGQRTQETRVPRREGVLL